MMLCRPHPWTARRRRTIPFIVFLPEIESEGEMEDESAIRCTRMSVQGTWSRTLQVDTSPVVRAATSHIDIPKLARFGLREEPVRTIAWIGQDDKFLLYTYAANELARENRGWRSYSFTIPMRPELRLGFPMYIPHKDMYGYLKTVVLTYNVGGEATMNVTLDSIRKRPMFPTTRTVAGQTDPQTGQPKTETILTTQPNLVMKWTKPPATGDNTKTGGTKTARPTSSGDVPSNDPEVNLVGNPATLGVPADQPKPNDEATQLANYRKQTMGTDWSTRSDTTTHNFRVQNDKFFDGPGKPPTGQPFFSREKWLKPRGKTAGGQDITGIDAQYFQAIVNMQPFTDEKGYEVVGVFPFGRWKSLAEAYKETREGKLVDYVTPQDQTFFKKQDALLFAGLGVPSYDAAGTLLDKFKQLTEAVNTNSSFELVYPTDKNAAPAFGPQPVETNLLKLQQPDNQPGPISDLALLTSSAEDTQQRVNMFLAGTPQPLESTKQELQITQENTDSPTSFQDVISDFKQLGKSNG
jgi:hypothetical protein